MYLDWLSTSAVEVPKEVVLNKDLSALHTLISHVHPNYNPPIKLKKRVIKSPKKVVKSPKKVIKGPKKELRQASKPKPKGKQKQ